MSWEPVLPESVADPFLGRQVGSYRLLERIGAGGMGTVYRAVTVGDGESQQVAVKLIKHGMDTELILRRFHTERIILASLNHPNIAHLIDAGTTEDGFPYVVMEHVAGQPITTYCDRHRLTVEKRLELFRKICSAVQCAHEKQVVHRDIKPANILVTEDSEPKLLDFGIAKVLDHGLLTASQQVTLTLHPVMTPQYASPEQARGEQITPASDIYSLGMLLYELVTGHRPYRLHSRSPHELVRVICEQQPEKPSRIIFHVEPSQHEGDHTVTPEGVSAARKSTPAQLRRSLTGDLSKIVLTALRKEPERRYRSVRQFSDDVGRYLEGSKVSARGDSLAYRGRKFIARWRYAIVLVLLLLASVTALYKIGPKKAGLAIKVRPSVALMGFEDLSHRPQTQSLSTQLTEMLRTELTAGGQLLVIPGEQVSQVKLELGLPNAQNFSSPILGKLRNRLNADYVVTGSYLPMEEGKDLRVRLDLRLQDTASGNVISTVAETQDSGGLLPLVTRTGALLRRRLGVGGVTTAESSSLRGSLPEDPEAARAYAEGLEHLRTFDTLAARELLSTAVRAAPQHALSHSALAVASGLLGYDAESSIEAKKALDLSRNLSLEDRLFIEGRYYESMRAWDKAVDLFRTLYNYYPDNVEYGLRLAAAQTQSGDGRGALVLLQRLRELPSAALDPRLDLSEAETAFTISDLNRARAAAARAADLGSALGSRVLTARARLLESRILVELGNPQRAVAASNEARSLYASSGHRQGVAWALNEGAAVLTQLGDIAGARQNYDQALVVCREIGNQSCIAVDLDSIGVLLRRQGDFEGSLEMHQQALTIRRSVGDSAGIATSLYNLANVLERLGEVGRARAAAAESLELRRALGQKRAAALALMRLARLRQIQGEISESLEMHRRAVAELRAIGDRGGVAFSLYNLAQALYDRGSLREARAAYEEALQIRRQQRDKSNTAEVLSGLASVALAEGDLASARGRLEESVTLRKELGEQNTLAQSRLALAELSLEEGRPDQAEALIRQSIEVFDKAKARDWHASAELLLSRCLAAKQKQEEGRQHLDRAQVLLRNSENRTLLLSARLAAAGFTAARGRRNEAVAALKQVQLEASKAGLTSVELQIRLALAQLGEIPLTQVAQEASQAGFQLIARKATTRPAGSE